MGLIHTVAGVLKSVGDWAFSNPERAIAAIQSLDAGKKYEPGNQADRILVTEQRLNQLNERIEKQNKKLEAMYGKMQAMDGKIRKLKLWLTVTGIALALAIAAVAVFAFWL